MKLFKKKINIIIGIVILLLIIGIIIYFTHNEKDDSSEVIMPTENPYSVVQPDNKENVTIENNIKTNNSKKVKEKVLVDFSNSDKELNVYITDSSIVSDINNDKCTFKGVLHNDSEEDLENILINFIFYSSKDKIIDSYEYNIDLVKKNDTYNVEFYTEYDDSNAKYFTAVY